MTPMGLDLKQPVQEQRFFVTFDKEWTKGPFKIGMEGVPPGNLPIYTWISSILTKVGFHRRDGLGVSHLNRNDDMVNQAVGPHSVTGSCPPWVIKDPES